VFADVGRNLAAQPAAGRLIEPEMDAAKDARVVDVVGIKVATAMAFQSKTTSALRGLG